MEEKLYHIGITPSQGAKYAILPGDPGRVEKIAKFLDNPKFLATNREYTSWEGTLLGQKVIVMSTGMGGPSTAICIEELVKAGVDTFIRIGTCGGMQLEVEAGDIVISNGAIRMDGTTKEYVPIEYPAVPDFEVVSCLVNAAKKHEQRYHIGVTQSKDSFYGQHKPKSMPVGYELLNKWDAWIKAGCLASEMECSTVFTVGAIRRARTAGLMLCVWNAERREKLNDQREVHNIENCIEVLIEGLKQLIKKDSEIENT